MASTLNLETKFLIPTLKILLVFLCEAAANPLQHQRVAVELVTYLDSCKGVSRVLGFVHQIG